MYANASIICYIVYITISHDTSVFSLTAFDFLLVSSNSSQLLGPLLQYAV